MVHLILFEEIAIVHRLRHTGGGLITNLILRLQQSERTHLFLPQREHVTSEDSDRVFILF